MSEIPDKPARKRPQRRRSLDVFTTGEVAVICHVSPRTAAHWVDNGQLSGYRLPGSKDRRVTRDELLRFITASGMPSQWLTDYEAGRKAA